MSAVALVVESEADTDEPLGDVVAEEGPVVLRRDRRRRRGRPVGRRPRTAALDPSASLVRGRRSGRPRPRSTAAPAMTEPDEVDLDDVDGPPTPTPSTRLLRQAGRLTIPPPRRTSDSVLRPRASGEARDQSARRISRRCSAPSLGAYGVTCQHADRAARLVR